MKQIKKLLLGLVLALIATSSFAAMGFLKGEQISGMNKICYYDVLGSTMTLNISTTSLCPLTYNF